MEGMGSKILSVNLDQIVWWILTRVKFWIGWELETLSQFGSEMGPAASVPTNPLLGLIVQDWERFRLLGLKTWTAAYQAPPSMGFSRQEYWSELPFPSPGDLPDPGTEPRSPTL